MIPESNRNKTIDLYKSISMPDKWIFVKHLFSDIVASDFVVSFHEKSWWLFTTITDEEKGFTLSNNLHVYFADNLIDGEWLPHPLNPIVERT